MDLHTLAQEYVTTSKFMQLATSNAQGVPWICTVNFVTDTDLNFYWVSLRSRQHSQEIISNPKTAVTVVKSTKPKQALQMAGEAREVADQDLARVHELYETKFGSKSFINLDEMKKHQPNSPAYWVFTPTKIMFFDEANFPEMPQQRYR